MVSTKTEAADHDIAVRGQGPLRGVVDVPGDKSISHRAALFAALAEGRSEISGFLAGADCLSTLSCLRVLGVRVEHDDRENRVVVQGVGLRGLQEPNDVLDCGNSGTTMRLLAGLLAGQPFLSVLTGDASLRSRPMQRVTGPLGAMGARIDGRQGGRYAPLTVRGGSLQAVEHHIPVASAQVKSALLLAGLYAGGETRVSQPAASRDHTERMLAAMGAPVTVEGAVVRIAPPATALRPLTLHVPGDISAAAFWLVAGACVPGSELRLPNVGVNPTRAGVIDVLRAMGANIEVEAERVIAGEPVADLVVRGAELTATEIGGDMVPRLIDEIPVLALAAACARGTTVIRDAEELRVKESDRIVTTAEELSRLGADITATPDGMIIRGDTSMLHGGAVASHGDHRLAMTLAVAGLISGKETVVHNAGAVQVSYPAFWRQVDKLAPIRG